MQKIVSGKWNMLIIYLLSKGTLRFGELHRSLPTMTQATLSKQLKMLEEYGILIDMYIIRYHLVEYSLTEIGQSLPVLNELEKWSNEYEQYEIINKQKSFAYFN
ncbi:MAG: winged helix-turn-helix transcriptional regulator [Intestinibacter sp.]